MIRSFELINLLLVFGKLHLVYTIILLISRQINKIVLINPLTHNTLLKLQHPNSLGEFVTLEGFMNVNFYVINPLGLA